MIATCCFAFEGITHHLALQHPLVLRETGTSALSLGQAVRDHTWSGAQSIPEHHLAGCKVQLACIACFYL